ASLRGDDRIAFHDALAGVRPLAAPRAAGRRRSRAPARRASPVVPREAPRDVEARARLAALVGGGVRFDLDKDADGGIQGLRAGADPSVLRELRERNAFVEATLDLHGMRGDEAERRVTRFVRAEHRRGLRRLCIVHGKGLHSESGAAVLRDRVVHALSEGGAAPVVLAFATAAPDRGGHGALLVALTRRR
ncbi:MAG: Smr/MutS family protein, partial [Sandaracinaceae bacterium]